MRIIHIVAHSKNKCIGNKNKLIWNLPDDLKHFKKTTLNSVVIMGRKTLQSLPHKLKDRTTIVVSSKPCDDAKADYEACSIERALHIAKSLGADKVYIAGGASIYKQTLHLAHELIVTEIDSHYSGDAYYPEHNYIQTSSEGPFVSNGVSYNIVCYVNSKL